MESSISHEPHAYTEDQLVEQPAIGLFAELGWQTVSAMEETFGADGTLGRETKGEVVLVSRLRAALERLNPALPPEAITAAVDELTRDRSAMSLEAANREIYLLLKDGIIISVPDRNHGGQKTERVRVIDWEQPENNDFLLVSQFSVTGALYTCRPDLVGFVNGLPWVVIELKKPGVPARTAFDENLTHYKREIPALFWYNALLIAPTAPTAASVRSQRTGGASSNGNASSARTSRGMFRSKRCCAASATARACSTWWRISRCSPSTRPGWSKSWRRIISTSA